jgi:hypothetical protein
MERKDIKQTRDIGDLSVAEIELFVKLAYRAIDKLFCIDCPYGYVSVGITNRGCIDCLFSERAIEVLRSA